MDLASYLDDVERDILVRALAQHRYNRTAAGASMGLSLRQMRYRMARLGVVVGGDSGVEGAVGPPPSSPPRTIWITVCCWRACSRRSLRSTE